MAVTGEDLAKEALRIESEGWGYIFGTAGEMWTPEKQEKIEKTKKDDDNYRQSILYGYKWFGHMVADCSGLIVYILKKFGISAPHGSNSQWRKTCNAKGSLTAGFKLPVGALVFKLKGVDDYYHEGIYVGNDTVIEARGTSAGVVKSRPSSWGHYGLIKGIQYSGESSPVPLGSKAIVDVPNDGTLNVRAKPVANGKILNTLREGTEVDVIGESGDWTKIRYTAEGFVMTRFLKGGVK